MELPIREKGDVFSPAGKIGELVSRLSSSLSGEDIPVACFYPVDSRSRMLPSLFYDTLMIPAGLVAIVSAFRSAGFKPRGIFQTWSPNVRPSLCRIDGRAIQIMTTSTMQINSQPSYELIADAWSMGQDRPLILAGGPKAIYQPEDYFALGPGGDIHADAVATGEELVLLELLDRVTQHRAQGETMLRAFQRCRDDGLLDDIPGLVFMSKERDRGGLPVLCNTGPQRLVQNLDELPHPSVGLRCIEPRHRRETLSPQPIPQDKLHKNVQSITLVATHGCRLGCPYCPISAYNQRTWRHKSPQRLVDELKVLREQFNVQYFLGADDNFFNSRQTAEAFLTEMARATYNIAGRSRRPKQSIRFCTEATELDVYNNRDLIPLAGEAGMWGIWFGIEDLAARLINKGQTPAKTIELFRLLNSHDILSMVMMMYYDGQPLRTAGNDLRGLLNQARFLFKHGAGSYQCSLHSPALGSREFERTFSSGTVIKSAGGTAMHDVLYDGHHVVASSAKNPADIHWNQLKAYAAFYNPVHLARLLLTPNRRVSGWRAIIQAWGMITLSVTAAKSLPWLAKEGSGQIEYWKGVPEPRFTIKRVDVTARLG